MADLNFVRGRSDFTNAIKTIRTELCVSERGNFRFLNLQVRAGRDIFVYSFLYNLNLVRHL